MGLFDSIGSALPAIAGGVGGFALGGPAGAAIGAGLLGGLGSALGAGGGGPPEAHIPNISADTQNRLDQHQIEAGQGAEALTNKYMSGVNQDPGALSPTGEALSARAKRAFHQNAGDLSRQASYAGTVDAAHRAQQAAGQQITLDDYKRGVDSKIADIQLQQDATRSQVMGQLFGGIGSAAGTMIAMRNNKNTNGGGSSNGRGHTMADYQNLSD